MSGEALGPQWYVEVTEQQLSLDKYVQQVTQPEAGAISTFIGITRNNFQGKSVLHLEYEAYVPMAVAQLQVCTAADAAPEPQYHLLLQQEGFRGPHKPQQCMSCVLQGLCQQACSRWSITRVAVAHRTGRVDVGEASVIIAVSSPHRKEAIEVGHSMSSWAPVPCRGGVGLYQYLLGTVFAGHSNRGTLLPTWLADRTRFGCHACFVSVVAVHTGHPAVPIVLMARTAQHGCRGTSKQVVVLDGTHKGSSSSTNRQAAQLSAAQTMHMVVLCAGGPLDNRRAQSYCAHLEKGVL
jgi:molybdopterin synthase catalytic subunit